MATSALTIAAIVYGSAVLFAVFLSDRVIFQPSPASYTRASLPLTMVPVGEDSLAVRFLPDTSASCTFIFSHGNAEDLGDVEGTLQQLHGLGCAVLGYDYRGYGLSKGGRASATRARRDIAAVYRFAVDDLHVPPGQIILYGRSVGSGPTMDLASHSVVGGIVLESAFTGIFTVVTGAPLLPFEKFPNLRSIRRVTVPLLVIHGTNDAVVPFRNGQRLFAAARGPKWSLFVEGAGHNDVASIAGKRYENAVRAFSRSIL